MVEYPQEIIDFLKSFKTYYVISRTGRPNKNGLKFIELLEKYQIIKPAHLKLSEFAIWIVLDIKEHPKCRNPTCNKYALFSKNVIGYFTPYCCFSCYKADPAGKKVISKIKTKLYQNPEWKAETEKKKVATCLKNHGVEYPMQNLEIFEKQIKSCFSNAKIVDGLRLIGYEDVAYEWLKQHNYTIESGTEYLKKMKIRISWKDNKGKTRKSYPDFFIREENMFVEIKSDFTRLRSEYKCMKAKEAINKMGYNYVIMTIDSKIKPYKLNIFESFLVKSTNN